MIALKRILVPHDFSETSDAALKYAIALTRTFGAKLHVLHVSEKVQKDIETEFPLGLDASLEDALRERLSLILPPREQKELHPEFHIGTGSPHAEILHYATEHDIDLIVMGTHGRGVVGRMVMGSVADKVVRYAPCPVLTTHNTEQRSFVTSEALGEAARPTP